MTKVAKEPEREFEKWCAGVDFLLRSKYSLDLNDVGWTREELKKFWRQGEPADEFVEWFSLKYDLDSKHDLLIGSYQANEAKQ